MLSERIGSVDDLWLASPNLIVRTNLNYLFSIKNRYNKKQILLSSRLVTLFAKSNCQNKFKLSVFNTKQIQFKTDFAQVTPCDFLYQINIWDSLAKPMKADLMWTHKQTNKSALIGVPSPRKGNDSWFVCLCNCSPVGFLMENDGVDCEMLTNLSVWFDTIHVCYRFWDSHRFWDSKRIIYFLVVRLMTVTKKPTDLSHFTPSINLQIFHV